MQPIASFGRTLRERRKDRDLTQEDLARQVGCAVITIKKIESDALRPSKQIAELLAEALNIPAEQCAAFVHLARATPRLNEAPSPRQVPPPPLPAGAQPDLIGRAIKGYKLRERLGAGGFGVENPYKGLCAFTEADAADFCGRATLIERILSDWPRKAHRRASWSWLGQVAVANRRWSKLG